MELEFIVNKDVSRPIAYDENSKNGKVLNGKEKNSPDISCGIVGIGNFWFILT
ncbi:hypothetical protein AO370_0303 [Moraxella catarrhalis]|uniref:Uncharacterized protein n=1 Tax=Moraxella catarrhalis TaxID=480 RepID=A0AB36DR85_MORCA|nr:hypothetical protein AO376_1750 [Moraxella catarrhalis]OAV17967.1 hypothetical protein AO374_1070 [Moraxella catarrhalis]OAV27612.1 hypothetical protein AO370_0303 [Moraxella catarrhalis]